MLAELTHFFGDGFLAEVVSNFLKNVLQKHLFVIQFYQKAIVYLNHKNYEDTISILSLSFSSTTKSHWDCDPSDTVSEHLEEIMSPLFAARVSQNPRKCS